MTDASAGVVHCTVNAEGSWAAKRNCSVAADIAVAVAAARTGCTAVAEAAGGAAGSRRGSLTFRWRFGINDFGNRSKSATTRPTASERRTERVLEFLRCQSRGRS